MGVNILCVCTLPASQQFAGARRPETVESLHILYHLTGNTTYVCMRAVICDVILERCKQKEDLKQIKKNAQSRRSTVLTIILCPMLRSYQQWGWDIFEAFEKYSKVEGGGYVTNRSLDHPQWILTVASSHDFYPLQSA